MAEHGLARPVNSEQLHPAVAKGHLRDEVRPSRKLLRPVLQRWVARCRDPEVPDVVQRLQVGLPLGNLPVTSFDCDLVL